jgi:hypothetical protein
MSLFDPCLKFIKARSLPIEWITVRGSTRVTPANLGRKQLAVTNTLAYYDMINYGRKRFNSTGP